MTPTKTQIKTAQTEQQLTAFSEKLYTLFIKTKPFQAFPGDLVLFKSHYEKLLTTNNQTEVRRNDRWEGFFDSKVLYMHFKT